MFYQGGPIDHSKHVPGPVSEPSAESEYNVACTKVIALSNFRMLNNDFLD